MRDWPANAVDVEGAVRLLQHGLPALEPLLPDMVLWLKNQGPVRDCFGDFLARNGSSIIPAVREALKGSHEGQIGYLLRQVLARWSRAEILAVQLELEQLLQRGSLTGLNIEALDLLTRSGAETHAPISEWAALFRRRLEEQSDILDRIEGGLNAG